MNKEELYINDKTSVMSYFKECVKKKISEKILKDKYNKTIEECTEEEKSTLDKLITEEMKIFKNEI